ncbi:MAG: biopolymer transporter ExbD [Verrucomicrobiota bacterium]|nr:biopolymer transporter ExbD [Verrucomicrobiota bacterium]
MRRLRKKPQDKPEIPIAPLIDAVFLLLIYFMVTSSLEKQEADISFELPGTVEQEEPIELPDEQIIEIREDGQIVVNEYNYDAPGAKRLIQLQAMLTRLQEASVANKTTTQVTIAPDQKTKHSIIIRVMDAVSAAGITGVNFAIELD